MAALQVIPAHPHPRPWCRWLALWGALTLAGSPAQAILFYSTADPNYNTTPPAGALAGSGWELQGFWGGFLGTPVGPRYFLSAQHIGGIVGAPFVFHGATYTTAAVFDDASSDLRLWQIDRPVPTYAQLYSKTDEVGRNLVVFGRGTQRGSQVWLSSSTSEKIASSAPRLRGWEWGILDGLMRWGENQVSNVVDGDVLEGNTGPARIGDLLTAQFQAGAGTNLAQLSTGDSGGAIFINDGLSWKLAGINYGADGIYSFGTSDAAFAAALFDQGGMYAVSGTTRSLVPDLTRAQPGSFYATRVSAHLAWIEQVISAPIVAGTLVLQSSASPAGPFTDAPGAVLDPIAGTFTVPVPMSARYYRVSAPVQTHLTGLTVSGTTLVLSFAGGS